MDSISNGFENACFVCFEQAEAKASQTAADKAAIIVQKHIRGQLARQPFLSSSLVYGDYRALCEKAKGPGSNSMPQATKGKTKVYLPKEESEVALKLSGRNAAIKRFHQMREVRSFLNSQKSSHLIIPRAKLCGDFLVEQRLPINVDSGHNMVLYVSQIRLFDDAVREFVRLFSKRHIVGLTHREEKKRVRYDNIPFYVIERNGKKEGCIGLIDLERIQDNPAPHGLRRIAGVFPLHLDLIKEEAKLLKMNVNDESLEAGKSEGIDWLIEAGREPWGQRFYSHMSSSVCERTLYLELILLGNPSQEEVNTVLLCALTQSTKDPDWAIYIYKLLIAQNPRNFKVYVALCSLLEDPVEKQSLFLKAAGYAMAEGKPKLARSFHKHAEKALYPGCISQSDLAHLAEGESPVYPTSMSQEDLVNPAAFLKKLPPMPQPLVDFLEGPCPIYEGKQAKDTHFVAPLTKNFTKLIDGKLVTFPRTVESLNKFNQGFGGPGCINDLEEGDNPSEIDFEWAIMTRDVFPGSKGKDYDTQWQLFERKGYQVPSVLEAATCILWENSRTGIYFYNHGTYTRCRDLFDESCEHAAVGDFSKSGLYIYSGYDSSDVGMAGILKFPVS